MPVNEVKVRRMPAQLKQWLVARAEDNFTSINIEILQLLKTAKQAEEAKAKAA
jgi:hypothetical protein